MIIMDIKLQREREKNELIDSCNDHFENEPNLVGKNENLKSQIPKYK